MTAISPITIKELGTSHSEKKRNVTPLVIQDAIYPTPTEMSLLKIPLTKPHLTPPQWQLFEGLSQLHEVGKQRLDMHISMMETHFNKLKELSQEHLQLFKEAADKTQSSLFWATLRQVGATLVSAFSTLFGLSLATSGGSTVIAGSLIASGVLAITNLTFAQAGIWDKAADQLYPDDHEKRKKFLLAVPGAIGLLSAGLGLAGGSVAWSRGSITFADKVINLANSTVNTAQGITSLGATISKTRMHRAEADIKCLDLKMFAHQNDLDKFKSGFEKTLAQLMESYKKTAHIITTTSQSSSQITLMG